MIVEGLREVKESITRLGADVNSQWSRLPQDYVPRREVEHRLDEHTIDIGEVRSQLIQKGAKHEVDVERLERQIHDIEAKRQADRRWLVGTALAAAAVLVALVGLILTQVRL